MFGISIYEFIIIILVAIVVLKPQDFIKIVVFFNDIIKKIKNISQQVQVEIEKTNVVNKFEDYHIVAKNTPETKDDNFKDESNNHKNDNHKHDN